MPEQVLKLKQLSMLTLAETNKVVYMLSTTIATSLETVKLIWIYLWDLNDVAAQLIKYENCIFKFLLIGPLLIHGQTLS